MENTELHNWGMAFVNQVDAVVDAMNDTQPEKSEWMEGEWGDDLVELCRTVQPDITEEQLEWVEQFLSEI